MRYWGELKSLRGQSVGEAEVSHACSFKDMWKRKPDGPTNSRKAGYAHG